MSKFWLKRLLPASAVLTIDRDRASSFGISPAAIDATLYDAIGQRQVAQYFTQLNSYHVVLEVTPALTTIVNMGRHPRDAGGLCSLKKEECRICRCRQEFSNKYSIAKSGIDTSEYFR